MAIIGFDVETAPVEGHGREFALQPWRVLQKKARITYAAMVDADGQRWTFPGCDLEYWALSGFVPRHTYVAWNAVFDLAWIQASCPQVSLEACRFEDAMLLWKHVDSTQSSYSLASACRTFLSEWPFLDDYLALKKREIESGFQTKETEEYNYLDAQVTVWIYNILYPQLTDSQRVSYHIEQNCLLQVAKSWLEGSHVDAKYALKLDAGIKTEMASFEEKLGLSSKTLNSRQMTKIVYEDWGCPVRWTAVSGGLSVDKNAIALGIQDHPSMPLFADWKMLSTIRSKFTSKVHAILEYNGCDTMFPSPRVHSTVTRRFTYQSMTTSTEAKLIKKTGKYVQREKRNQTSFAVHQISRRSDVKDMLIAPPGHFIVEFDASGQESRFMAIISGDQTLINMFNKGMDTHSYLGAELIGMEYAEFMQHVKDKDPAFCGPDGHRALGKLGNLSCQYRIGSATLQRKALADYELAITEEQAKKIIDTYKITFPGIPNYWHKAEVFARHNGYAESLDGHRHYIHDWSSRHAWKSVQTAINQPIQGTGASQKYLALWQMGVNFPEFRFFQDLHDGLYFYVKEANIDKCASALDMLNHLDYKAHWGVEMPIDLPWDCKIGRSRGSMRDLESFC